MEALRRCRGGWQSTYKDARQLAMRVRWFVGQSWWAQESGLGVAWLARACGILLGLPQAGLCPMTMELSGLAFVQRVLWPTDDHVAPLARPPHRFRSAGVSCDECAIPDGSLLLQNPDGLCMVPGSSNCAPAWPGKGPNQAVFCELLLTFRARCDPQSRFSGAQPLIISCQGCEPLASPIGLLPYQTRRSAGAQLAGLGSRTF